MLNIRCLLTFTMDFQTVFDVADTPGTDLLPSPDDWPSPEDFSPFEILPFRNLPLGTFKLLKAVDRGVNKFGSPAVVLKLQDKAGKVRFVWATHSLATALTLRDSSSFLMNLGLQELEGRRFFKFTLC